ncbi:hypothetical protein FOCG_12517 [Fusarium oxysporum f. sp. radicis-lycopersici 26381]|nr:hypothetical protein FOWG_08540 [Fusarium oxysporum f. sp. lycopersici MN25]EXL46707.1 hypothetical protein FOCG_12517 [Fusarium oxysporum f. sp. radicis-lycopersici 26381]EXL46708.1 hypothetical protein FOCG_12517 [Fusarium oxysporum f. sp. radicis-lycopersici 26381]
MLLSLKNTYTHCLPTYVRTYSLLPRSILLTARHHHNHQTSNPITPCTLVPEPITPIHCSLQSPYHLKEEQFSDSTQSYSILISSTSTRAFIKETASTTITGKHHLSCYCTCTYDPLDPGQPTTDESVDADAGLQGQAAAQRVVGSDPLRYMLAKPNDLPASHRPSHPNLTCAFH